MILSNETMAWHPGVLRKYNTTGHFRLLNQLRADIKNNPLKRPQDGQSVAEANRSQALRRALDTHNASGGGYKGRRPLQSAGDVTTSEQSTQIPTSRSDSPKTFRERLNAIEMR